MCLENCEAEVKKSGRTVQFGWVIWELKSAWFIEAEFHAVVRTGSRLIDITPRIDGEDRILFVPDAFRKAIRIAASEWLTWTNIKSSRGIVQEQARQIRIVNLCQ
jgi:hypothetical protein